MKERSSWEVGQIVAARRARLRLDSTALAKAAEVDPKTLRSLERGDRWPRDGTLRKIESALSWQPGSLDSLKRGGPAKAIGGLAAIDEMGDEQIYISPDQVDVPENTETEARHREVMRTIHEIQESSLRYPDPTSAIVDRRIRSAGRLLNDAAESLSKSDMAGVIDSLDASAVVIRSTISELQKDQDDDESGITAVDTDDSQSAPRAPRPEEQKIKPGDVIPFGSSRATGFEELPEDAIAARERDQRFHADIPEDNGIGEENQDDE